MLLMTFKMFKILLKSPQLTVMSHCNSGIWMSLVLAGSFFWPWHWFQVLVLVLVLGFHVLVLVFVLEHKVLDNITAKLTSPVALHSFE